MMRKNTRNKRYPFHPLTVDKILSMVLADMEIKLWTSVNGTYTGSEILVKRKYSF
jgi:hypothetical protein